TGLTAEVPPASDAAPPKSCALSVPALSPVEPGAGSPAGSAATAAPIAPPLIPSAPLAGIGCHASGVSPRAPPLEPFESVAAEAVRVVNAGAGAALSPAAVCVSM